MISTCRSASIKLPKRKGPSVRGLGLDWGPGLEWGLERGPGPGSARDWGLAEGQELDPDSAQGWETRTN
jgi:hypothetical protein